MSIRITTTDAIDAELARERRYVTGVLAGAVEGITVDDCTHPHRPQCPKCVKRQTIVEAAGLIRKIGGVKP